MQAVSEREIKEFFRTKHHLVARVQVPCAERGVQVYVLAVPKSGKAVKESYWLDAFAYWEENGEISRCDDGPLQQFDVNILATRLTATEGCVRVAVAGYGHIAYIANWCGIKHHETLVKRLALACHAGANKQRQLRIQTDPAPPLFEPNPEATEPSTLTKAQAGLATYGKAVLVCKTDTEIKTKTWYLYDIEGSLEWRSGVSEAIALRYTAEVLQYGAVCRDTGRLDFGVSFLNFRWMDPATQVRLLQAVTGLV